MEDDLGMKGNQYQTAVSILFVTYILSVCCGVGESVSVFRILESDAF